MNELYSLHHGNIVYDLTRIKKLTGHLDNPHLKYHVIHVAGTNGKGSICSLLASILQESGLKVGLYTSPHIVDFNERIRINGKKISNDDIEFNYKLIKELAHNIKASFFEITTAIAFNYFTIKNVDIAVIETGLGGKLDSTNIVNPILSIISTISIDHQEILGNTQQTIAKEKAGIIKSNVPVILQDTNPQVVNIIQKAAFKVSAPLFFNDNFPEIEYDSIDTKFKMHLKINCPETMEKCLNSVKNIDFIAKENTVKRKIVSDLIGLHQIKNIQNVIFASLLLNSYGITINYNSIIRGIENVVKNTGFHFRIESIYNNPNIIVDIAHNPQSIETLVKTLKLISPEQK